MRLIQKIKQYFCQHTYSGAKLYPAPFHGHIFRCPKCNGRIAYFKAWDDFVWLSENMYQLYVEEGKKLHDVLVGYDEV